MHKYSSDRRHDHAVLNLKTLVSFLLKLCFFPTLFYQPSSVITDKNYLDIWFNSPFHLGKNSHSNVLPVVLFFPVIGWIIKGRSLAKSAILIFCAFSGLF